MTDRTGAIFTGTDKDLFVAVLTRYYSLCSYKYPTISIKDVERFKVYVDSFDNLINNDSNTTDIEPIIDPAVSQTHNIESWVAVIKKGHAFTEFLIGLAASDGI